MQKKLPRPSKISFIIVNYRSAVTLQSCFVSIKKNMPHGYEYEIILVNNDQDVISEDISENTDTVIELGKNHGYGYANNRGAEASSGDIICFINPDALFLSRIAPILEKLTGHGAGIVAPKLITVDHSVQEWSAGAEMTIWELLRNHLGRSRSKDIWESQESIIVDWVSGAALFIRRDLFESLHGFDQNFFLYWEDIDLCRSARLDGAKVMYCPDVEVCHLSGASSSDKKQQKRYYDASQDYYFKKNFHPLIGFFVRMLRRSYRLVK